MWRKSGVGASVPSVVIAALARASPSLARFFSPFFKDGKQFKSGVYQRGQFCLCFVLLWGHLG